MQTAFQKYNKQSIWVAVAFSLLIMVLLTLTQDYISSTARQGAYYFSESFLFSSFWWLFVPLIFMQIKLAQHKLFKLKISWCFLIIIPFGLHLIFYPLLVALLSGLFYSHTFRLMQTLEYAVTNYADALLIVYVSALAVVKFFALKMEKQKASTLVIASEKEYISSFMISFQDKKIKIAVEDILCFTASKPYVLLQTEGRNYLYSSSLTALSNQLDSKQFLRIHKSSLINLRHVKSCVSRANGDYDLTLTDGRIVRLSRTYAKGFKEKFFSNTQLG